MNSRWVKYGLVVGLVAGLALMRATGAETLDGFTVAIAKGECEAQAGDKFEKAEAGKKYPFGTTVRTGRNSLMDLQFSDGNTFRLLARTKLVITEDVKNPKLKVMRLDTGSVELKLDNFPKDHKLQVETPTAVCGAVGTRFGVSFEWSPDDAAADKTAGNRENRFSCDKGQVFVASRFSVDQKPTDTLKVDSMVAGSELVATIHEGLQNSYTDVTVNRGTLNFNYGGGAKSSRFSATPTGDKPTRFVCALEKSEGQVTMAAVEVKSGEVESQRSKRFLFSTSTEKTAVTPNDGAVVVSEQQVYKHEEATAVTDYIAAAKKEGELHSQWVDAKKDNKPTVAALEKDLYSAADKATELRKKLLTKQMLKAIRDLKTNAVRPQNMPRH